MVNEKGAFDIINGLLAETDYPATITSIADIEEFLLDDGNRRFTEEYPVIGRIYDDLRGKHEIDRYPSEPSVVKEAEEQKNPGFGTY